MMNTINTVASILHAISNMRNIGNIESISVVIKSAVTDGVLYSGTYTDCISSKLFCEFEAVFWEFDQKDNTIVIFTNLAPDSTYTFELSLVGEESTSGKMKLTLAEAILVDRVTNSNNWDDLHEELYGGTFDIMLDKSSKPVIDEALIVHNN